MKALIIRLHPAEPVSADLFKEGYLTSLKIEAFDVSLGVADEGSEQIRLGSAEFLLDSGGSSENRIFQHYQCEEDSASREEEDSSENRECDPRAVATAIVELKTLGGEYLSHDVFVVVMRGEEEVTRSAIHYNVPFHDNVVLPSDSPDPPENVPKYGVEDGRWSAEQVSLYLRLPAPSGVTSEDTVTVELPPDGAPPNFEDLMEAVKNVVKAEREVVPSDTELAKLIPEQCRHIAYEIVWNRQRDSTPTPSSSIPFGDLYTTPVSGQATQVSGQAEAERRRFEGALLSYYATNNAKAERLSTYVYALAAALQCEQESKNAVRVGFRFPVLLGQEDSSARIKEVEVVLKQ